MLNDAYREAGVDIDSANLTKKRIKELVRSTFGKEVLTDIGSFGGLFKPDFSGIGSPVLVSSADGVGTKLKVAVMAGTHNTVGADLVNHCCNDILVMGAKPLFFLDYLAYGKHDDTLVYSVIEGITKACKENSCALIGGEMAEMPDMYAPGEYDLAGVIVGVVGENDILDGSRVKEGDAILGLPSSGLHTNGYSLARKLIFEKAGLSIEDMLPGTGQTVAESLLAVHISYVPVLEKILKDPALHALAHITGGGFTGNIDRSLPENLDAVIDIGSWEVPPLFKFLVDTGKLSDHEAYRTFNMGIGMTVIIDPAEKDRLMETIAESEGEVHQIGVIEGGSKQVRLIHGK